MRAFRARTFRLTLVATLVLSLSGVAAMARTRSYDDVRESARTTYIHGMTDEIAQRDFGRESVPDLLELLRDPEFDRRDNVVAILGYLGAGESTTALLSFIENPTADVNRPVEDRSLLLAPQSLGQIASRGDRSALRALLEMTAPGADGGLLGRAATRGARPTALRDDLVQMALRGLAFSGAPEARGRIDAIAQGAANPVHGGRTQLQSAKSALDLFDRLHDDLRSLAPAGETLPTTDGLSAIEPEPDPWSDGNESAAFDGTHFNVNHSRLDYVNHANVTDPMTDARLDQCLAAASARMGQANFSGDVACCSGIERKGTGASWGSTNDGLDMIDDSSELNSVLNHTAARFKVVRAINYCGGSGTNIIGCAWIGGNGAAVVRYGSSATEGALWAHEYGHNVGLNHNTIGNSYIMYGTLSSSNTGLTQAECDLFHTPSSGTAADLSDAGACTDGDADEVQDVVDNCPGTPNNDQADGDGDGVGDLCEGGCGNGVLDDGEECDSGEFAGASCSSRGFGDGALACTVDCTIDDGGCTTCGNGVAENGEDCDGADLGGASCAELSCNGGQPSCSASCTIDYGPCLDCPVCDNDGVCEAEEDCDGCPGDCIAGAGAICGNGVCDAADGEDCVSCPADCRGKQNGRPGSRYCCGAGGGDNPVPCSDSQCNVGSDWICSDLPGAPSCCGDLACDGIESSFNCEIDCGPAPYCGDGSCGGAEDSCSCDGDCGLAPLFEADCGNGSDDDCDGFADCSDADCSLSSACSCQPRGATCSRSDDCCSGKCRRGGNSPTCR